MISVVTVMYNEQTCNSKPGSVFPLPFHGTHLLPHNSSVGKTAELSFFSSIQSSRVCGKQGGKQQSSLILGLALAESYLPNRHNHWITFSGYVPAYPFITSWRTNVVELINILENFSQYCPLHFYDILPHSLLAPCLFNDCPDFL